MTVRDGPEEADMASVVLDDERDTANLIPTSVDKRQENGVASISISQSESTDLRSRLRKLGRKEPVCTIVEIAKLAAPVGVSLLVSNLMTFQTILFCGHAPSNHSDNETRAILDAAALSSSFSIVTGLSVLLGAATACDTLFAQAYGSKNKKTLGIIVQQSILILGMVCLAVAAVWVNAASILVAAGQNPHVARLAGEYFDIAILSLPGLLGFIITSRYLQSQSITLPTVVAGLIANAILATVDYFLVFQLDMGLRGAAWGYSLGMLSQPITAVVYIRWKKLHVLTWPGWSWACLDNWLVFSKLAIAGGVMVCLEWWSFEVFLFISGTLGEVPLAVTGIVLNTLLNVYMVAFGLTAAANIIVGNSLGSGDWQKARTVFRVATVLAAIFGAVLGLALFLSRNVLGYVFTSDMTVIEGVAVAVPSVCILQVFDYIQSISAGVIRGAGRQTVGAISNLIAYYLLTIPIGVPLMLKTSLGVRGFGVGMTIGMFFLCAMYMSVLARVDWKQESVKAQNRVKDAAGVANGHVESVPTDTTPVELTAVMTAADDGEVRCVISGKDDIRSLSSHDGEANVLLDEADIGAGSSSVLADGLLFDPVVSKARRRSLLLKKLPVLFSSVLVLVIGVVVRFSLATSTLDDDGEATDALDIDNATVYTSAVLAGVTSSVGLS